MNHHLDVKEEIAIQEVTPAVSDPLPDYDLDKNGKLFKALNGVWNFCDCAFETLKEIMNYQ